MGRKVVLVIAVLAVVAGGCAKSSTTSTSMSGGTKGVTVELSPKSDEFNAVSTQYFPNALSAHPGDTITFKLSHFNGEPHTITLGSLVNAAVTKADALGAN